MTNYFKKQVNRYFDKTLGMHVSVFNLVMFIMIVAGTLGAVSGFLTTGQLTTVAVLDALLAVIACVLLQIADKKKCYRLMSLMFCISAFFVFFPALFFNGGGSQHGMDYLFVIAIMCEVVLLSGKERKIIIAAQIVVCGVCFMIAYYNPQAIKDMSEESKAPYYYLSNFALVCAIVMVLVLVYSRVFKERQKQVDKLNEEMRFNNEILTYELEQARTQAQKAVNGTSTTIISLGAGEITLDIIEKKVYINERDVRLTNREFAVLRLLVKNENKEISSEQILTEVWGDGMYYDANSVRVCVSRLRKKLEEDKANNFAIFTSYGQGYTFTTFSN